MIVEVLLVLLLLLGLMIVVGYGLLLLISRLFRGPAGSGVPRQTPVDQLPHRCPTCRMLMRPGAAECPNCAGHRAAAIAPMAAAPTESPPGEDDWDITARQVRRLLESGLIDSATFVSLDSAIRAARTAPATRPPPLPVQTIEPDELVLPPLAAVHGYPPAVAAAAPAEGPPVTLPPPLPVVVPPTPGNVAGPASPPPPPPPPVPAAAPRRPFSQVLASFMERKNIRWGELVGGLLIVGCSIALVLSSWAQIQQHPLLKFSIFTAVTAGLFALGLYSEHRWKLATTSRGILLTATLLVPLNFLAFAAFSHGVPAADPIALGGEAVAFLLFSVLAWFAARVIVPQWPASLTIGVMGLSVATLAVRYLSLSGAGASTRLGTGAELPLTRVLGLWAWVVACYGLTSGGVLFKVRRNSSLDAAGANAALLSLAVLSFAAAVPLALIVSRGADGSLHRLAPLIALSALPALAGGVLLRKRLIEPALVSFRVVATAVSVIGAAVLLAGIVISWPSPGELLATSIIAFAALLTMALGEGSAFWVGAAQAAATLATAAAVVFFLDWGDKAPDRAGEILSRIATWQLIAATWAGFSTLGGLLRRTERLTRAAPAFATASFGFDRLLSALLLAVLAAFALLTTSSAVLAELVPGAPAWPGESIASHVLLALAGPLPWLVLALLLAAHVANAWQELRARTTWPALVIPWVACPLWAACYSGGLSGGASAFRWAITAWLLLAAGVVWWQSRTAIRERRPADPIDVVLVLLGVVPILALSIFEVGQVLFGNVGTPNLLHGVAPSVNYILPLLAVTAFLIGQGRRASFWWSRASLPLPVLPERAGVRVLSSLTNGGPSPQPSPGVPGEGVNAASPEKEVTPIGQGLRYRSSAYAVAATATSWLAGPLWAAGYSASLTGGAPMFRWVTAAWLLLAAGVVWWRSKPAGSGRRHTESIDAVLVLLGVVPIVALSIFEVGVLFGNAGTPGVNLLHGVGPSANYILPLLAVTAFLIGQGLRYRSSAYAVAATATSWLAGPFWAAGYSASLAGGAPMFRWVTAAWLLLAAGVVWWRSKPAGSGRRHTESTDAVLVLLGVVPIVALSIFEVGVLLGNARFAGTNLLPGLGSSVIPLLAVVAYLIGQSLRYRSNGYAVAAMLAVNLLVTTAYVVATAGSGGADTPRLMRLTQLNIATAAAASLVWLCLGLLAARRSRSEASPPAVLRGVAWAALAANLLLIGPAAGELFLLPDRTLWLSGLAGKVWGWLALGLSALSVTLFTVLRGRSLLRPAGLALPMAAALAAFSAAAWDHGNWLSLHVWMGTQTAVAWAVVALGWWLERRGGVGSLFRPSLAAAVPRNHGQASTPVDVTHTASIGKSTTVTLSVSSPSPGTPGEGRGEGLFSDAQQKGSSLVPFTLDYQQPGTAPLLASSSSGVRQSSIRWAGMLGLLAVVLALRAALGDPAAPWPSAAVVVFVALLAAAIAVWTPAPAALYPAAGLLNLAAMLVYAVDQARFGGFSALGLAEVNAGALALPAIAWLVLELQVFRRMPQLRAWASQAAIAPGPPMARFVPSPLAVSQSAAPERPAAQYHSTPTSVYPPPLPNRRGLPVHQFASFAALAILGSAVGFCLARAFLGFSTVVPPLLDVAALAALAGLLFACLWDEPPIPARGLLYLFGLIACVRLLECANVPADRLAWAGALMLAGYGLLTSALYALRGAFSPLAAGLRLPVSAKSPLPWLELANAGVAAAVLVAAFWSDFAFDRVGLRLLPAIAALTQAGSLALLATKRDRSGRQVLVQAAALVGVAALLAIGWAFLAPALDPQGLQHAALAAALLTAAALPLALVFAGRKTPLIAAAGRPREALTDDTFRVVGPILTVACLASLAVALGLEAYAQAAFGRVLIPAWAIAAMAAAAFSCCVTAVILAFRPWPGTSGPDSRPGNTTRIQAGCVYAAEALLALLFLHVRLTLPFLFHGYLQRYWPLIVMAVAFAGVGLGEAFRRRGRLAFAQPLQNTGVFLPLIPVLAFWVFASHVHYTLLLALAAALYGSMAFLRQSTLYGLTAALAGNGALWYLLSGSQSLRFFAHPQVWVIPAALSGLVAAEMNRSRLTAAQLRTSRYFFVVALYLSSTADIFINGAAHSTWLPLALAALSVGGVLAGVALRVRPFLFLGTAFLTLSVIAMIYNAAASLGVTWIWYVAGILLGLFIIVLFALFEKKRSTMLALVEGLKAWE